MEITLINTMTGRKFKVTVIKQTACFATVQEEGKKYTMKLNLKTNHIVVDSFLFTSDADIKRIKANAEEAPKKEKTECNKSCYDCINRSSDCDDTIDADARGENFAEVCGSYQEEVEAPKELTTYERETLTSLYSVLDHLKCNDLAGQEEIKDAISKIENKKTIFKDSTFSIYVVRNHISVFVGSLSLDTVRSIHKDTIKTINYESKIIYLDPETSPYGK